MSVGQIAQGAVPGAVKKAARKDWLVIAALGFLALVVLLAVCGPILAPYDYTAIFVGEPNQAPSTQHLFGTDSTGGDIFSRFLVGTPASLIGPLVIVALSTLLGASLAITSAWFGGILRGTLSRLIDVIFAIPGIVIAVLAVAMFGRGMIAPVVALSIAYIPVVARLTQTAASRELGRPYISALRVQGVSSFAICFKHLVPAMIPVVVAQMAIGFGYSMLDLAAISYLGLGQQPPAADWGRLIFEGQTSILEGYPEMVLFPAAFIVLTVLSVSIIGARVTVWAEEKER